MKIPDTPPCEAERLALLAEYQILDTEPEHAFDQLVAIAAEVCEVPIALVSLVDEARQWFKASVGLAARETPRDVSFCGHAVAQGERLVVEDAHVDPRFADNPLVTGDPQVRFYAGAPLVGPDRHVLGTLCVIDREARSLSDSQLRVLDALAAQVVVLLEHRRLSLQLAAEVSRREELERRAERFFDHAPDLFCVAGFDGKFRDVNPAWTDTLGLSREALLSKDYLSLLHEEDVPEVSELVAKLSKAGGVETDFEARLVTRDGGIRRVVWSVSADLEAQLLYAAGRDVTEMMEERERTERMKDQFISTVSHEMRTPLTSIRGALGLLVGGVAGTVTPKAQSMLEIAHNNSLRLARLVNDILDLEKIEAGRMEFTMATDDLRPVVAQAISSIAPYAERLGVEIQQRAAERPIIVHGDPDRLEQVLTNLLSNAAKFCRGRVVVDVEAVGQEAVIGVEDNGPGIPEEMQASVFGRFVQSPNTLKAGVGGSGLGLGIARAIVQRHQGTLDFECWPERGTRFEVRLPLVR